jgi:hypothetical protein
MIRTDRPSVLSVERRRIPSGRLDLWITSRPVGCIIKFNLVGNTEQSTILISVKPGADGCFFPCGVSNQVVGLSNTINTLSTQANWTSNQLPLYTPLNNTQTFLNDSYAKISSNTSSITWTSNSLVSLSPLTLEQYGSSLAVYGSNSFAAAQTTANFSSNLIPTFMTFNIFYPLRSYDSNTSTWSSNQLATLNTTADFISFSNYVSPLLTFGCNALSVLRTV